MHQPSGAEDSGPTGARDEGKVWKKNQYANVPDHDTRIEQAETRTEPARMRASEIRYRRLFEAARDGILILDPSTRKITDANPFMSELLG